MSSTIGNSIKVTLFGESHGEAVRGCHRFPARRRTHRPGGTGSLPRPPRPRGDGMPPSARRGTSPTSCPAWWMGSPAAPPSCAVFENGDTQSQEYLKNRFLPPARPWGLSQLYPAIRATATSGAAAIPPPGSPPPLPWREASPSSFLARRGIQVQARLLSVGGVKDIPLTGAARLPSAPSRFGEGDPRPDPGGRRPDGRPHRRGPWGRGFHRRCGGVLCHRPARWPGRPHLRRSGK